MVNKVLVGKVVFSLVVLASTLIGPGAFAQNRGADTFNRSTGPTTGGGVSSSRPISGNAALGKNDPISRWFDDVDYSFAEMADIPVGQRTIIARPFNSDAKRVAEWSKAIKDVAHKYRGYAKYMRTMQVPNGIGPAASELQTYRDATANYYDDTAEYFEDWTRPRQPAVTREELQAQLDQMHQRSEALKVSLNELLKTDQYLRTKFDVRGRDDALMRYVAKQPNK